MGDELAKERNRRGVVYVTAITIPTLVLGFVIGAVLHHDLPSTAWWFVIAGFVGIVIFAAVFFRIYLSRFTVKAERRRGEIRSS